MEKLNFSWWSNYLISWRVVLLTPFISETNMEFWTTMQDIQTLEYSQQHYATLSLCPMEVANCHNLSCPFTETVL